MCLFKSRSGHKNITTRIVNTIYIIKDILYARVVMPLTTTLCCVMDCRLRVPTGLTVDHPHA